ncbi:MAG: hypothetical protein ACR2NA_13975 [Solirubrobacterales bacterium]
MTRARLSPTPRSLLLAVALVVALVVAGCGGKSTPEAEKAQTGEGAGIQQIDTTGSADDRFPTLVEAEATEADEGRYDFDVTISSPYDSPERYADGWRVLDPDGEELGAHELAHDHADEQPFTRTQRGVEIPDDLQFVQIEGHDLENGYGGDRLDVELPGR